MVSSSKLAPLDPDTAAMERRWRESGIPDIYTGRDGPVGRERARNVRALLYPKPVLPTGRLDRFPIPGPNGPITVGAVHAAGQACGLRPRYRHGRCYFTARLGDERS
jgi:hypothetical protein